MIWKGEVFDREVNEKGRNKGRGERERENEMKGGRLGIGREGKRRER